MGWNIVRFSLQHLVRLSSLSVLGRNGRSSNRGWRRHRILALVLLMVTAALSCLVRMMVVLLECTWWSFRENWWGVCYACVFGRLFLLLYFKIDSVIIRRTLQLWESCDRTSRIWPGPRLLRPRARQLAGLGQWRDTFSKEMKGLEVELLLGWRLDCRRHLRLIWAHILRVVHLNSAALLVTGQKTSRTFRSWRCGKTPRLWLGALLGRPWKPAKHCVEVSHGLLSSTPCGRWCLNASIF